MLLKYKYIKKTTLLILKIFFFSYYLNCFAGGSKLTELDLSQQQNYISNSIDAFFETKSYSSETTVNHIFSPYSLEGCLVTYGKTQHTHSTAKDKLNDKLIKLEINPDISLSSKKKSKLQLLTAILTKDEVTHDGHNKLNSENIFLGQYLLQQDDSSNDNIKNRRQAFQDKIKTAIAEMFSVNLDLDYQSFWSPAISSNSYLKVVSAIKFQDHWRYKPFDCIGLNTFYTKDNKQIQTGFIQTTIEGAPVKDNASNWKAIRLFYEDNYAIYIILPAENKQITKANKKKKIICSLIRKLNKNKINYKKDTNVIMPKFEHRQKNCLDSYVYKILEGITPDYKGFLVDYDHTNLLSIDQECYIKIDKNGTTAEAITDMTVADGMPAPVKDFLVNRSYFFVISEYQKIKTKGNLLKIKNIIMIGEVGNPSEQLIVPK